MNTDSIELLRIFDEEGVEFLVVGAHAVAYHAEPRFAKHLEIWVSPTPANAAKVWRALHRFSAPLSGITERDFTDRELVYQLGLPPHRIDVVMGIDGLEFDAAWANRVKTSYGGVPVCLLSKADLICNKRASGRPQDLLDVMRLEESE